MLVNDFLQNSAKKFPKKEALIFKNRRLTYQEINKYANQLANALIDSGIERGDRVAIYMPNSVEVVISIFAVLKAGGVFIVINHSTKTDKLKYILNNSGAKAFVCSSFVNNILFSSKKTLPLKMVISNDTSLGKKHEIEHFTFKHVFDNYPATQPDNQNIDVDLAALIYTSGSTGLPKGVMMTHSNIISAATSITQYLENTCDDIIINTLPLSFDYGLYQMLMAFKMGATLILEHSFSYPFAIIDKILKEKVTGFPIVPTMAVLLLQLESLKDFDFSHLRYISNTAAHLPSIHIKKLREIFPKTKIYCMYGLTECKRVSYLPPDQIDVRPNSVGKGMPNEEVYLVNEKGERIGAGEVGELVVRGSNVMKGYWGLPKETDEMLKPGLFPGEKALYTGDLFKMDEEGYLYFISRKDDIIKTKGEKVSPKEVENVIYKMGGISEVAVIGTDDEILGQAIKAFVVSSNGRAFSEKEIKKYCSKNLEDFMVPSMVEFRSSLPKTTSGKIKKAELS
ncbi:AMP-binding protein [candidate division KSB1 bacterium]|nr:AMP-binding protein [candidate division KSB1 bacterium]